MTCQENRKTMYLSRKFSENNFFLVFKVRPVCIERCRFYIKTGFVNVWFHSWKKNPAKWQLVKNHFKSIWHDKPDSYKANAGHTYKVYGILEHVGRFTFLSKFTAFSRVFPILFYFPCQNSSRRFKQSCAPLLMKHNIGKITLLNFVGYCDLASFKKVHPETKKLWAKNTGQPKSARAFCCLGLWKIKVEK